MVSNDKGSLRRSRSVERALLVLCAVAVQPEPVGVSELARRTGLPKSTVHLSLQTMRTVGFIEQAVDSDGYVLGLQAAQLGVTALDTSWLGTTLSPRMERLAERSGEAVSLGIRTDRSVLFVRRFETAHRLGTTLPVGSRMPLHASASGKCLLSGLNAAEIEALYPDEQLPEQSTKTIRDRSALVQELAEVRERGCAFNTDEFLDGVSAAAVPVAFMNRVVATVSIAGPTMRFNAHEWVDDLLAITAPSLPMPVGDPA